MAVAQVISLLVSLEVGRDISRVTLKTEILQD